MSGPGFKPSPLVETRRYNSKGCHVKAAAKYKAVLQQVAFCHDTETRFDNQACADRTGHSLRTVERVVPILAEAGVVTITNPGTPHRQVKLAPFWLEYWQGRFPQVARLRDGKLAAEIVEKREAGAFDAGAEPGDPARAGGQDPGLPRQAGGHNNTMRTEGLNGAANSPAYGATPADSEPPEIDPYEPGNWEPDPYAGWGRNSD